MPSGASVEMTFLVGGCVAMRFSGCAEMGYGGEDGTDARWEQNAKSGLMREEWLFGGEVGAEVEALDEHAEDVFEGEVGLLDVHGDGGGDDDVEVAEGGHLAAAVAGEADGGEALARGPGARALRMFFELPEVEMPRKTSPGWPRASIWRAKTVSKQKSLPMAVRMEVSVVRAMARRAGRSTVRRTTNSATRCWASAAEPPLPATRSLRPAFMAAAVSSARRTRVEAMDGVRKHGLQGGDGLRELLVYDGRQRGLREVHADSLYGRRGAVGRSGLRRAGTLWWVLAGASKIQGSLHCAADDETVRCFGRDDVF